MLARCVRVRNVLDSDSLADAALKCQTGIIKQLAAPMPPNSSRSSSLNENFEPPHTHTPHTTHTRTPRLHFAISFHVEGKQKFGAFDTRGIQPAGSFWRFVAAFHFLIKHPKTDAIHTHAHARTHTRTHTQTLQDMILIRLERLKQLTY